MHSPPFPASYFAPTPRGNNGPATCFGTRRAMIGCCYTEPGRGPARASTAMTKPFDPYHTWLGIRPEEQPPNHYRLLALQPFEDNADTIEHAADQRMAHLRTLQAGRHSSAVPATPQRGGRGQGLPAQCRSQGGVRRSAARTMQPRAVSVRAIGAACRCDAHAECCPTLRPRRLCGPIAGDRRNRRWAPGWRWAALRWSRLWCLCFGRPG